MLSRGSIWVDKTCLKVLGSTVSLASRKLMDKAATLIQFERLSSNSGSRATTNESHPLSTAEFFEGSPSGRPGHRRFWSRRRYHNASLEAHRVLVFGLGIDECAGEGFGGGGGVGDELALGVPKDDSSDYPSKQYSNSDCEEPDPAEMARAEQRELQAMRDAYTRALQMRDRQPQPDDGHLEEDKDRA